MKKHSHNYIGGSITSHGYKVIYVGKDHHLANSNGYAYEHRVVAEKILMRSLRPGEIVHHKDGNKSNNAPNNLEVVVSHRHHFYLHRRGDSINRKPDEDNPMVECACGCGKWFNQYDSSNRPRKFISGHNGEKKQNKLCECGCGAILGASTTKYKMGHQPNKYGRKKIDPEETILCECGCMGKLLKYDRHGRPRRFISGHNGRTK